MSATGGLLLCSSACVTPTTSPVDAWVTGFCVALAIAAERPELVDDLLRDLRADGMPDTDGIADEIIDALEEATP